MIGCLNGWCASVPRSQGALAPQSARNHLEASPDHQGAGRGSGRREPATRRSPSWGSAHDARPAPASGPGGSESVAWAVEDALNTHAWDSPPRGYRSPTGTATASQGTVDRPGQHYAAGTGQKKPSRVVGGAPADHRGAWSSHRHGRSVAASNYTRP